MIIDFKTNTARSILAAANTFKFPHQVIWEYVVNEIQYRDLKINPKIYVSLNNNEEIVISGNGKGMNENDLKNFFTMHAENQERNKGNPGRGKFGTGKSAAYAIGETLTIETVRDKKIFVITLSRKDIQKYSKSGENIPLNKYISKNFEDTKKPNGTTIRISNLFKSVRISKKDIISFLEKHIKYFKNAEVWIDNHLCEPKDPEFSKNYSFNAIECGYKELGKINLVIKVSKEPLEKHDQGIRILSNQNLHEITLVGSEGREMANYIFGEIDCPNLDDESQEVSAFTMARDMTLNPENEIVRSLYAFLGEKIEVVRKEIVEEENRIKESEDAKKLQKQADNIANQINKHFEKYIDKIQMIKMKRANGAQGISSAGLIGNLNETLSAGDQLSAILNSDINIIPGDSNNDKDNNKDKNKNKKLNKNNFKEEDDKEQISKKTLSDGNKKSSGGRKFKVKFAKHGENSYRAKFVSEENVVYVNLDNPYISGILKESGTKDIENNVLFTKISREIAYTEYAMGLVNLMYNNRYFTDNTDLYLQEVRIIVNDLSIPFND